VRHRCSGGRWPSSSKASRCTPRCAFRCPLAIPANPALAGLEVDAQTLVLDPLTPVGATVGDAVVMVMY